MIILDVREKEEFEAEHIPGSILCPMSQLDLLAPGILKNLRNDEVSIMCRSGNRAKMALKELSRLPNDHLSFSVFEGGILRWKQQGRPVQGARGQFPIMRQVQIVAGSLILLSVLGYFFISPAFIYLAAFVGAGLTFAGVSGFCGMALLLQRMPWNKSGARETGAQCGC